CVFVKLIVFDILGREISTLVNEQLKAGSYEVEWKGSNFSSGIYFYSLMSYNFIQTRKLVLIK
ncbi:MAG: T9SS type A sorting domain-containing protein, partial [Ignavibacteria bacterium]|nr:T9SS type A sorting domain-containing protein [Ignavibacteria bacterium]